MNNRNFVIPMRPSQLPPAVEFYIYIFFSFFYYFFLFLSLHDDYDKCRYHTRRIVNFLSANSQTGIIRSTSGLRRGGREEESLGEERMISFLFVSCFLRPSFFQFSISSRNSAQKAGGRLYDLAHNSDKKEKGRIPARWVNCL